MIFYKKPYQSLTSFSDEILEYLTSLGLQEGKDFSCFFYQLNYFQVTVVDKRYETLLKLKFG